MSISNQRLTPSALTDKHEQICKHNCSISYKNNINFSSSLLLLPNLSKMIKYANYLTTKGTGHEHRITYARISE